MYAIIQSRGHQVKVTPGGVVMVDGTVGEPGAEFTLEEVLLVEKDGGEVLAGAPFVANARVVGVAAPKSACSRRSAARACAGPRVTGRSLPACASRTSSSNVALSFPLSAFRADS